MKFTPTELQDVIIFEPKVFEDQRGFFYESFNHKIFEEVVGREVNFVQDNHSNSKKNVLRGLHLQSKPYEQGKLVRCSKGEIYDVAVDLRLESSTFGKWIGENLSAENKKQLWIPEGFAHGFYVLSESAEVQYKTTNYYSPKHEIGLHWNDVELGIDWFAKNEVILSPKDEVNITLRQFMNLRK